MNICVYWEQYSWGGVDSYLKTLLTHWPDKTHNILILSNRSNVGLERIKNELSQIPNLSIETVSIYSQAYFVGVYGTSLIARMIAYILFPLFLIQNFFVLWRSIPRNIDILISQNGSYPGGWSCQIALFVSRLKKIAGRVLVIHHSSTPKRRGWWFLEFLIDKFLLLCADRIITVSKASLSSFIEQRGLILGEGQGVVIYNGVELPQDVFAKHLFKEGEFKIGIVGRCEARKGHFDLLNSLTILSQDILTQIHLYFVGYYDQDFYDEVEEYCKKNNLFSYVTMTGYMPQSSVEVIGNLDLLCCLTQDYEGFGLTVIEAMAVGVPVLSTDVGALKEFLIDGVNCVIVRPNSPADIAAKIGFMLENREKCNHYVENGKVTAKFFTADRMSDEYLKCIMNVIK